MYFPVRVYSKTGKLKKTITSKQLEKRGDAALLKACGFSSTFIPIDIPCPECGITFTKFKKGTKFCSSKDFPYCGIKYNNRTTNRRTRREANTKKKLAKAG